jgi:hypothetical protein
MKINRGSEGDPLLVASCCGFDCENCSPSLRSFCAAYEPNYPDIRDVEEAPCES